MWICPVRAGQIVSELTALNPYRAYKALKGAGSKLPIKVKGMCLKY